MNSTNFSEIAARYERDSLIQKSAAEKLLGVIDIKRSDNVLDLGCGTGSLTRRMRALTDGKVTGVDASEGMISEARGLSRGLNIEFHTKTAEELVYQGSFDVIFCNSTFQWFSDPGRALSHCHAALKKGGRMGIQAPAKKNYCPNFLNAIDAVARNPRTVGTFSGFRPPWTFLDTEKEYALLFERAGFTVPFALIEEIKTSHKPEEVMTIFESGAAAGYLNRNYYETRIDGAYAKSFREIAGNAFHEQSNEQGQVELIFNRIYLLAVK